VAASEAEPVEVAQSSAKARSIWPQLP
jgi:hypothetical protein